MLVAAGVLPVGAVATIVDNVAGVLVGASFVDPACWLYGWRVRSVFGLVEWSKQRRKSLTTSEGVPDVVRYVVFSGLGAGC